jgi:hypothetical protein
MALSQELFFTSATHLDAPLAKLYVCIVYCSTEGKGLFSVSCMGILVMPATLDLRVRKLTEPTGVHAPLRRRRKSMKSTEGKERGVSDTQICIAPANGLGETSRFALISDIGLTGNPGLTVCHFSLAARSRSDIFVQACFSGAHRGATMEDMKVTASGYDFGPAHAAMRRYVDGDILSGLSSAVLVGRDLVDVNYIGWADKEAQVPLRVDHIFRVHSNTKLITSCAALQLFEEGRFQLDDPIERFIPQLANRRVLRQGDKTRP